MLNPSAMLTLSSPLIIHLHPPLPLIVRYVPSWFPGTGWKVKAKLLRKLFHEMTDAPFQFVKDQMVSSGGLLNAAFPPSASATAAMGR